MRATTQGFLILLLGAVLLRISITGEYLRFVTEWMRWPLLATGLLLVLMGVGPILRQSGHEHGHDEPTEDGGTGSSEAEGNPLDDADHAHPVPAVTWLLVLPVVVMFVVAPPALGSYVAERRATDAVPVLPVSEAAPLSTQQVARLTLGDFLWRAAQGRGRTLRDREVRLVGFVSYDNEGAWYLTRLTIGCCAADAAPYRVQVRDAETPPRDQWVAVTGEHVPSSGGRGVPGPAAVAASSVEVIEEPAQPYE